MASVPVLNAATTPYTATVISCNSLGCGAATTSNATGTPFAPSSLDVRVAGEDALSVRIGYPLDDDGGANVTHYNITVHGGFEAPLEVFQSVPTQGANGWEAFSVGGRQMLAVANYHDDSTRKINSVIYEYAAASDSFVEFQSVPTQGPN